MYRSNEDHDCVRQGRALLKASPAVVRAVIIDAAPEDGSGVHDLLVRTVSHSALSCRMRSAARPCTGGFVFLRALGNRFETQDELERKNKASLSFGSGWC